MNQLLKVAGGVLGAVYVLFVPGFVLSYVFFRRGLIDIIERLALSFALSIAVVPLVAFYLNLAGVRISRLNVILEVAGITLAFGAAAWWVARRKPKQNQVQKGSVAPKTKPEPPKVRPPQEHPKTQEPSKPPRRKIQF